MSDATAPAHPGHGTKGYRAYVLAVLLLIYTFNFIDRILVGVVQEGIRADLQLSDLQLGLLGGTFFAILYSVLGVPIARWAERANRVTIISIGAALWSVMTAACGFAQNFMQLALARVGVGIGEAACVPPSHSLISDYFPAERRASALAIFALGVPIGSMFAAVAGGWLAQEAGWRAAFWLLGAPGIAAALLLYLTVREPPRAGAATPTPSFSEALKALAGKKSFWHVSFAAALVSFFGYSTAQFTISFIVRVHDLSIAEASYAFGAIAGVAVAAGTFLGGYLSDRWAKERPRVLSWLPAVGVLAAVPVYLLGYLQTSFVPALLLFMVASVLHYLYLGPIFAVAQGVVSPRVRATASAIMVLVINLIGYGLGPATAGALSDFFANQALTPNGLTASGCAELIAAVRAGTAEPTATVATCAGAAADGLRYALMTMSLALVWAAAHFMLAGRTLVKDRVA